MKVELTREIEKLCPGNNEEDKRCELGLKNELTLHGLLLIRSSLLTMTHYFLVFDKIKLSFISSKHFPVNLKGQIINKSRQNRAPPQATPDIFTYHVEGKENDSDSRFLCSRNSVELKTVEKYRTNERI